MIYGLYQSAAGMMVNEYRQNILANNLANAETVGFKRDIATFAERVPASEAGLRQGPSNDLLGALTGGTWLGRTSTDFSESTFIETDNPLDVALAGPGFLRVAADGQQYLTRDGRMMIDQDGWLVSVVDHAAVLGTAGQPIHLNPRGGDVSIGEDGRIEQDGATVGRLGLVDVAAADYPKLEKAGASRFSAEGVRLTASPAEVQQNFTESSGVEPVKELATMIEASRAYALNAEMLTLQDQTAGRLINAVSTR